MSLASFVIGLVLPCFALGPPWLGDHANYELSTDRRRTSATINSAHVDIGVDDVAGRGISLKLDYQLHTGNASKVASLVKEVPFSKFSHHNLERLRNGETVTTPKVVIQHLGYETSVVNGVTHQHMDILRLTSTKSTIFGLKNLTAKVWLDADKVPLFGIVKIDVEGKRHGSVVKLGLDYVDIVRNEEETHH